METIGNLVWSSSSRAAAAVLRDAGVSTPPQPQSTGAVEEVAQLGGYEAMPLSTRVIALRDVLGRLGPGVVRCPGAGFLAVAESRAGRLCLLDRRGGRDWVDTRDVAEHLAAPVQKELGKNLEPVFELLGGGARRRRRALGVLADDHRIDVGWRLVNESARSSPLNLSPRLVARLLKLLGLYGLQFLLGIAAWVVVARAALYPNPGPDWVGFWALLLASALIIRAWIFHGQGQLAIDLSCWIKQKLLRAGLRLEPEAVKRLGPSNLLSRVLESEALEANTVRGGIGALFALLELAAALMLLLVLGSPVLLTLLVGLLAMTAVALYMTHQAKFAWVQSRVAATGRLVEGLDGHATQSIQQPRSDWYGGQDDTLVDYLERSHTLDRVTQAWKLIPRLWLVLALPAFLLLSGPNSFGANAALMGVVLLVYLGLSQLTGGVSQLSHAGIVWRLLRPLRQAQEPASGGWQANRELAKQPEPALVAQDLAVSRPGHSEPILAGATVTLRDRERVWLQGPSGSGKSTLAAILAGHAKPTAGRVALGGLDLASVGQRSWRQRVCLAPQFHENMIFPETLAFNLLMGRRWPASNEDLKQAQIVCGELGLGDLLQRMPGGLMQMVGDGGWPLSHGEAARVQIARAVLQEPSVLILDESLGPLDPRSFARAIECLRDRIPTLVVVAHA